MTCRANQRRSDPDCSPRDPKSVQAGGADDTSLEYMSNANFLLRRSWVYRLRYEQWYRWLSAQTTSSCSFLPLNMTESDNSLPTSRSPQPAAQHLRVGPYTPQVPQQAHKVIQPPTQMVVNRSSNSEREEQHPGSGGGQAAAEGEEGAGDSGDRGVAAAGMTGAEARGSRGKDAAAGATGRRPGSGSDVEVAHRLRQRPSSGGSWGERLLTEATDSRE